MAIEASAILPSDSLEEFRVQFNNLISDVDGISGGNAFVSSIIFEGSTADANETTLLAIDPQQDNTITLPDVTGTFITTGNSGDPATTADIADVDHVLVNDGGVLKKITVANLGVGSTAADDISVGNAAVSIATSAGNITIDAQAGDTDIIFKGTDGAADITALTLDMSDAGKAIFTGAISATTITLSADGGVIVPDNGNIGSASATAAMQIASTGIVTFVDDILIKDAGTIGSASDPDAIAIGADGDVTLTQDLELQHDGAILSFGTNDEVSLTHVHDTGILLNSTNVIQFNDASQNIGAPSNAILDINATDEIELNATLVDINANVEISGTATTTGVHTFTAVPVFPNNTVETADIQADAITGAKIADDAINSEHYTNGSIDTAHIAADQIDATLIADNAINSEHYTDGSIDKEHLSAGASQEVIAIACGDESTAHAAATAVVTFHMPYAFTLTGVKAGVTVAPVGSVFTVDINEAGTTILSTKITIDASEKTSGTAATAAVISDTALAADALMTIDIDGVGSSTAGAGLKVYLIGHVT